jgi:hypothetical protein
MIYAFKPTTDLQNEAANWALNQRFFFHEIESVPEYFAALEHAVVVNQISVSPSQGEMISYYEEKIWNELESETETLLK